MGGGESFAALFSILFSIPHLHSPSMIRSVLTLLLALPFALAGTAGRNESCDLARLRLQEGTYQLYTDCNSVTYCAANNNTCQPRGCRRDDFPFGYSEPSHFPDKCPRGQFCPDEEDACQPLLPVGSDCQLNRDDECEAPPNFAELSDDSSRGLNVNGSVCLNNKCMWANASLGVECVVENTPYIAYSPLGEFIDIVSRDNCRLGLYCDAASKVCMATKALGETCSADKECTSWNCSDDGVCAISTDTPTQVATWVYVIVAIGIFGGMFGILTGLFIVHRRQRDVEREKRAQYWREQNAFHQNLMQMREAARASIRSFSGKNSARSTMYGDALGSDESHTPILQQGASKGSGLRQYTDGSDYDDHLIQPDTRGRF
jgi:hypothetical protein